MTTESLLERLDRMGVDDPELRRWADGYGADLVGAWDACARGDWRMWLAAAGGIELRELVRAAHACASDAMDLVPAGETRPRRALDAARPWLNGEPAEEHEITAYADAAEAAAAQVSYRDPAPPGADHAARAAAWVARAADAARTAEVRSSFVRAGAEAGRLTRWMRAQSFYDAVLPAESGALEHAMADDVAFVGAAAAEAVRESARALAVPAGSMDDALARCDRTVVAHISPTALT